MPSRNDLAKIHIAKKELGLSDELYRDILMQQFGKESAADLTPLQAGRLLSHFQKLGWKPRQRMLPGMEKKYSKPKDAQDRKIVALWLALHQAGVVRDKSDQALQAFVKRMTGIARLQWCASWQKNKVIEELKAWGKRKGVELE